MVSSLLESDKDSNKVIDMYAFYNNRSDGCFLTQDLKDQLELSGTDITLRLGTMHGQSYVPSTVINNLIVTDVHDQNPVEIPKLYTREFIPAEHKQIPTWKLLTNWKHLEKVSEEIPSLNHSMLYRAKEIDFLQFVYTMNRIIVREI